MADYQTPGIYEAEQSSCSQPIVGATTGVCAFVGRAASGPLASDEDGIVAVSDIGAFERLFGAAGTLHVAIGDFFANGGQCAVIARLRAGTAACAGTASDTGTALSDADYAAGFSALQDWRGDFDVMCIPSDVPEGDVAPAVWRAALDMCVQRRAMLLVDPPAAWDRTETIGASAQPIAELGIATAAARNAALYYPRLLDATGAARGASAAVAGIIAANDRAHGVWNAPAGLDAPVCGAQALTATLDAVHSERLNALGINALRRFPAREPVVWGARTLAGADALGDMFKYVPVRRLALYLERSLQQGLAWAVFETNDDALWSRVRASVGDFLHALFLQGAFAGSSPAQAYWVRCGQETISAMDVDEGMCQIEIGFAPTRPAEFVVLSIALMVEPGLAGNA